MTDAALLTVARHAGLATCDTADDTGSPDAEFYDSIIASLAEAKVSQSRTDEDEGCVVPGDHNEEGSAFDEDDVKSDVSNANSGDLDSISCVESHRASITEMHRGSIHQKMLERGRRDRRESKMEAEEEEEDSGEDAQRKEAMKVLCNVVYNSVWAQERFSSLRYAHADTISRSTAA